MDAEGFHIAVQQSESDDGLDLVAAVEETEKNIEATQSPTVDMDGSPEAQPGPDHGIEGSQESQLDVTPEPHDWDIEEGWTSLQNSAPRVNELDDLLDYAYVVFTCSIFLIILLFQASSFPWSIKNFGPDQKI